MYKTVDSIFNVSVLMKKLYIKSAVYYMSILIELI